MAKIVDDSAEYMSLPVNIKRGNSIPLDTTSVWKQKAKADEYAASASSTAYVGQILSVVESGREKVSMIVSADGTMMDLASESLVTEISGSISGSISSLSSNVDVRISDVRSELTGKDTVLGNRITTLSGNVTSSISTLSGNVASSISSLSSDVKSAIESLSGSSSGGVAALSANAKSTDESLAGSIETIRSLVTAEESRAIGVENARVATSSISTSLTDDSDNGHVPGTLATYQFVNSSINNFAAYYITKNANGDAFSTKAELSSHIASGDLYNGGKKRTPTKNDYLVVLEDESHVLTTGLKPTTRYSYDGAIWAFQYVVNNTTLTQDQVDALNSGVKKDLLGTITSSISTLSGVVSSLNSSIVGLSGDAKNADERIVGMVTGLSSGVGTLSGNAKDTDVRLHGEITSLSSGVSTLSGNAKAADNVLSGRIATLQSQTSAYATTATISQLNQTIAELRTTISSLSAIYQKISDEKWFDSW